MKIEVIPPSDKRALNNVIALRVKPKEGYVFSVGGTPKFKVSELQIVRSGETTVLASSETSDIEAELLTENRAATEEELILNIKANGAYFLRSDLVSSNPIEVDEVVLARQDGTTTVWDERKVVHHLECMARIESPFAASLRSISAGP